MNRLSEIASELKPLRLALAEANIRKNHCERDADGRKAYLIPMEGWPGSNDAQRKAAAEKTYMADEVLITLRNELEDAMVASYRTQAAIEALEDERRAVEWELRARQTEVLAGAGIPQEYTEPFDNVQTVLDDMPF